LNLNFFLFNLIILPFAALYINPTFSPVDSFTGPERRGRWRQDVGRSDEATPQAAGRDDNGGSFFSENKNGIESGRNTTDWWFGTMEFYDFPYIGNNHPN